jgi:tRNA(adenine34) deaminase
MMLGQRMAAAASWVAEHWQPASQDLPDYAVPSMTGGVLRLDSRELFRHYCQTAPETGLRRWAQTLADLPD